MANSWTSAPIHLCSDPLSSAVCWQHFLQGTIFILLKHQTQDQCLACFTVIPNLVTGKETEIQETELELCALMDLFFVCVSPGLLSDIRVDFAYFFCSASLSGPLPRPEKPQALQY